MAKEDLKLRVTSNAPLTTKGSPLTWVELDANWIEIYNNFVKLSQSSYVDSYDGGITYDDTINNYVMYANQLWKCISDTPIVGVTPVEGVKWTAVYVTDMVGRSQIHEVKRTLTADEINSGFSSEIEIISARGTNTFIELISGAIKFNASLSGTAFNATTAYIKTNGASNVLATITGINGSVSFFKTANPLIGDLIENKSIVITFDADGSSSPLGDGTMDIYLTYKLTSL